MFKCIILVFFPIFLIIANSQANNDLPSLIANIQPSVVTITTFDSKNNALMSGTGFILNAKGLIVSNNHVFKNARKASVKTFNGNLFSVTNIVAVDEEGDLILLKTNIPNNFSKPLNICTTFPLVGEKIIVIGNPEGFEHTVSDGIVSSVRNIPLFGRIIQITAPISRGSSGSPVVNLRGEAVGVASMISQEGQNLNFAISSERILKLTSNLKETDLKDSFSDSKNTNTINNVQFNNTDDILALGLQLASVDQYSEAIELFTKVLLKESRNINAYYYRSWANYEINLFEKALYDINCAIALNANDADFYNQRGQILSAKLNDNKDFTKALLNFNKSIELDTSNYESYLGRALIYSQTGMYENAISDFDISFNNAPVDEKGHVLRNKSEMQLLNGDTANAVISITKAIEYFKRYPSNTLYGENFVKIAYEERGDIFEKIKDYQKAINDYHEVLKLIETNKAENPDVTKIMVWGIKSKLAFAYHYFNKADSAIVYLTAIIKHNQNDTSDNSLGTFYYCRAENYSKLKKYKEAINDYTEALKYEDSNFMIKSHKSARGELYIEIGKYNEAIDDFKSVNDYKGIISVFEKTNKYKNIVSFCDSMISIYPNGWGFYFQRGKAYIRLNRRPEAVNDLNKFLIGINEYFSKNSSEILSQETINNKLEAKRLISTINK